MSTPPILYSFRRCPYAMRARMALFASGTEVELREVKLADKPPELAEASPKATVPVLVLDNGTVVDESIAVMRWALDRCDPQNWLAGDDANLIALNDGPFKHHLDRYKYPTRYPDEVAEEMGGDEAAFREYHRAKGLAILEKLDAQLSESGQLCGEEISFADIALFPFVRQFANTDRAWFDTQALPHLQTWLKGHLESQLFGAIMPKFVPWKSGDSPILFGPDPAKSH